MSRLGLVALAARSGRGFEFALERAVFVSVLHRLFVSGSDRSCEKWMGDYAIPGATDLRLHHLYRAMARLGEELEAAGDGGLAPRCVKDEIEERLFERRRDLFTVLPLVFMDTTTLSFVDSHAQALEAAVAGRGLVLGWRHLIGQHVDAGTLVMQGGDFVETGRSFHALLTEAGWQRPLARACLAFFGGAARHRAGWDET